MMAGSTALKKGGKKFKMQNISFASVAALLKELTSEEQAALVDSNNRRELKRFLRFPPFIVKVDYTKTFREMIADAEFDYIEPRASKLFSACTDPVVRPSGRKIVNVRTYLVSPPWDFEEVEVFEKYLNGIGKTLAKVEHLLALSGQHRSIQLGQAVICLGSLIDEDGWPSGQIISNLNGRSLNTFATSGKDMKTVLSKRYKYLAVDRGVVS